MRPAAAQIRTGAQDDRLLSQGRGAVAEIRDGTTIGAVFAAAVGRHGDRPFLAVPANEARDYAQAGVEISYREAGALVEKLCALYRAKGYGPGHHVATLLENRPEHVLHKLAMNTAGACCVPINPDYRAAEIAFVLEHCRPELVVTVASRQEQMTKALDRSTHRPPVALAEHLAETLPAAARPAAAALPEPGTPSSILYTSGTTGRPKGCVLSNGYEVASGQWYADLGGLAEIRPDAERIYNPLPLYHVNAGVLSIMGAVLTGNCQIQTDRFSPQRWWSEVTATRATVVHYLGVIVPLLLSQQQSEADRSHGVRFGIGAGVEPQLHKVFEERFGIPLIEVWGMTEMVRILLDNEPAREVGTRSFGRAVEGVEVRVVDDGDADVADGQPGEMVIRHSSATPRRGFFSGYLKDEEATEAAWKGGWFHTGDIVWRGGDGRLHFVDRKKNIIRRSGENIAAAEIEALLLTHPDVKQAAVMAVKDEVREEEVLACVVLKRPMPAQEAAQSIFRYCHERLSYYKAPGWLHVVDSLPTTGTQKIQKHSIYPPGVDPRELPGICDLRHLKKRA
ncbi:MAG: AMP-binding protein [Hyphomicrobiaceae bacterium]|nr:MAG: AMP-binding protein [Hyphomicrobiaceae bacterium]